mmetsp:Transcript_12643/g.35694  ORF Transcript_12643/g.35694 Transcript_12643/m.35694 type:complete len:105 (+) Transcript_12643:555-869(+)
MPRVLGTGVEYSFPLSATLALQYCQVEGIAIDLPQVGSSCAQEPIMETLQELRFIAVSDASEDTDCQPKDNSIHIISLDETSSGFRTYVSEIERYARNHRSVEH